MSIFRRNKMKWLDGHLAPYHDRSIMLSSATTTPFTRWVFNDDNVVGHRPIQYILLATVLPLFVSLKKSKFAGNQETKWLNAGHQCSSLMHGFWTLTQRRILI